MLNIQEIKTQVDLVAKEFPIKKVDLFGSFANGTATQNSDVDFLVEFDMECISLITLSSLKLRLEELLEAPVDVVHAPLSEDSIITIERSVCVYE